MSEHVRDTAPAPIVSEGVKKWTSANSDAWLSSPSSNMVAISTPENAERRAELNRIFG